MLKKTNGFLEKYYFDSKNRKNIIGYELMMCLEKLIADIDSDKYIYDTTEADRRIDFIENCVKLTKSPFYGQSMKLFDFQKAFISALYGFKMLDGTDRFQRALFLISRKNGKALALNTRVPTPTGDKTIGEITAGDFVYNELGQPTKVLATSEIFKNHTCYEIEFEDGEKIIADEGHKWTVQTKSCRKIKKYIPKSERVRTNKVDEFGCLTLTTADLLGDYKRKRKDGKGTEYKYRVPIPKAIYHEEVDLPLNPYILGLWLGDGDKNDNRISVAKSDLEQLNKILDELNCEHSYKQYDGKYEVRLGTKFYHGNTVRDALKKLNVYKNKHIPEVYFNASIEQRMELLRGLIDTDGTCTKSGECEFVQKNKTVAEGISRLLTSLGIKHSIKEKTAFCNGKNCGIVYSVIFYTDKNNSCFKFERKHIRLKDKLADRMNMKSIVSIKQVESVPTKCLCVDNPRGLFLCGEKNTVTHNSELCSGLILSEMIIGGKGLDIVCSSNDDIQASILTDAVDTMRIMIDPKNKVTWRNLRGIKCTINDNKVFKLSDKTRNKEGRNIDIAVIDEIHEMKENIIIKSIEQSQSLKINPKLILITTEGFINGGVLDNELIRARAILNDEIEDKASERYLIWLYTQDSESEIWNGNQENRLWEKSNPTLGRVKRYSYLEQQIDLARSSKADRSFVLSKDFNLKQSNAEAWLNLEDYDYVNEFELEDFKNALCLGAVDIAETTDLSSAKILLMKPDENKKYIFSHYFIPEGKLLRGNDDKGAGAKYEEWVKNGLLTICEGNYIDTSIIADWFYNLYNEYGFRPYKIGYDAKFANEFINRSETYGFETEGVWQRPEVMSQPIKMVEADLKDKLIFGLNEIDKWCLSNASLKIDSRGLCILEKIKGQLSRKIDGAVSLVILFEMFRRNRTTFEENL